MKCYHLVIRVLEDGKELCCSKLADFALRRFSCELLGGWHKGHLLKRERVNEKEICCKNLDGCCWKHMLFVAKPNQAA